MQAASPGESLVTVFRTADATAAEDASDVLDLLADAGLNAALFTDEYPGVPPGAFEVRVPPAEEARALDLLSAEPATEPGDASHSLDLVDIYQGAGANAELEAISVRAVLDANHIPNVLVGTSQMPMLPFVVRVPALYAQQADDALRAAVVEPLAEESTPG